LASPNSSADDTEKRTPSEKGPGSDKSRMDSKSGSKKKIANTQSFSDIESESENRVDFQNRLWRFLFSNISRAVDELYNLCEDEENRDKCHESIEYFEKCKHDFDKLIERIEHQKQFESDPSGAKGGISWEIRKPSGSGKRLKVAKIIYTCLFVFNEYLFDIQNAALTVDDDDCAASSTPTRHPPLASSPPRSAKSIRTEFVTKHDNKTGVSTPGVAKSSKLSASAAPFTPKSYPQGTASNLKTSDVLIAVPSSIPVVTSESKGEVGESDKPGECVQVEVESTSDGSAGEIDTLSLSVTADATERVQLESPTATSTHTPPGQATSNSYDKANSSSTVSVAVATSGVSNTDVAPASTAPQRATRPPSAWVNPIHIMAIDDTFKPTHHVASNRTASSKVKDHSISAGVGGARGKQKGSQQISAEEEFDEVSSSCLSVCCEYAGYMALKSGV
jgi:hypothetical protein